MRLHLASFVDDFRAHAAETAIVSHRAVRSYRTSYGELAQLAGRFSCELRRRGIGPGERVLLWGENTAEWIAAFFGCLLCGVIAVPLDATGSSEVVLRVSDDVKPLLIVGDAFRLQSLATGVPALSFAKFHHVLPAEPDFRVDPAVQEDTPFQIIFTSGTTSEPKGIVHTHRNVLASLRPIEAEIGKYLRYERWFHPLRFLHTLPLSHVFGQFMGLWIPGLLAAELHFTDALESSRIVYLIRRERISVLIAVPRILGSLRAHLLASQPMLGADLGHVNDVSAARRWWRFRAVHGELGWKFWAVISGGASLPAELELFWNQLGFALIQGYGMTETAALITLNHPFRIARGTVGKVLPGREIRLSDSGELLVRGEMVAGLTWQSGRLQPRGDEWLATGDLAKQSEEGDLRFLGRIGDAIVLSNGMNVYPADLEAAMLRQPGVQACAVVPCELANGPQPVSVVIFLGDETELSRALLNANRELAEFQHMRHALRWAEITFPYTSTGKLLRRSIREWACSELRGDAGADSAQPEDFLLATIHSITGASFEAKVSDNSRLSEDLHLDSLGRVQLATAVEQRTGIMINDAQIASLATLGDLRRAASGGGVIFKPDDGVREMLAAGQATRVAGLTSDTVNAQSVYSAAKACYPHWPWSAPILTLRQLFTELVLRPLISILLAPRVVCAEELPSGPMLMIANHVTVLDGALVLYALPARLRRQVATMMSGEMLAEFRSGQRAGFVGRLAYWLLTALFNVFPLPRLQGFRQSFTHAGEAMDKAYSVLVFPEGARSPSGALAPFRQGIGLLAEQARVPVLPVALIGLDRVCVRGAKWFRSGQIEIRIGSPVAWREFVPAPDRTAELEAKLRALCEPSDSSWHCV